MMGGAALGDVAVSLFVAGQHLAGYFGVLFSMAGAMFGEIT